MLRRSPFTPSIASRDEKEFFPFTGVSYVVLRVSRGIGDRLEPAARKLHFEHRQRLESMLSVSRAVEMLAGIQKARK